MKRNTQLSNRIQEVMDVIGVVIIVVVVLFSVEEGYLCIVSFEWRIDRMEVINK